MKLIVVGCCGLFVEEKRRGSGYGLFVSGFLGFGFRFGSFVRWIFLGEFYDMFECDKF